MINICVHIINVDQMHISGSVDMPIVCAIQFSSVACDVDSCCLSKVLFSLSLSSM